MSNKVAVFKKGKGNFGGLNEVVGKDDIFIMDGGGPSYGDSSAGSLTNGIVSGNGVAWVQNFDYEVTPYVFNINNVQYSTSRRLVTLEGSHATLDRIDIIVATFNSENKGSIEVVKGVESASPVKPTATPYQIEITSVNVDAGSVKPAINTLVVFDEGAEFAGTDNTTSKIDYANTDKFFSLTKSVKFTGFESGDEVTFTGAEFNPNDYTVFQFLISSNAKWEFNGEIEVALFNVGTLVSEWIKIDGDPYNIKGNDTFFQSGNSAWQTIVIPMFKFFPSTEAATQVVFRKTSLGSDTFHIDLVRFQQGVTIQTPLSESTNFIPYGEFSVYTAKGNLPNKTLQINDLVSGYFSPTKFFILAKYLGGPTNDIGSWDPIDVRNNP